MKTAILQALLIYATGTLIAMAVALLIKGLSSLLHRSSRSSRD